VDEPGWVNALIEAELKSGDTRQFMYQLKKLIPFLNLSTLGRSFDRPFFLSRKRYLRVVVIVAAAGRPQRVADHTDTWVRLSEQAQGIPYGIVPVSEFGVIFALNPHVAAFGPQACVHVSNCSPVGWFILLLAFITDKLIAVEQLS
jgi:hypothetical protein